MKNPIIEWSQIKFFIFFSFQKQKIRRFSQKKWSKKGKGGKGRYSRDKEGKAENGSGSRSINVRHILCENVWKPWARFNEVAMLHNIVKTRNGGSLGWQTRGAIVLLDHFKKQDVIYYIHFLHLLPPLFWSKLLNNFQFLTTIYSIFFFNCKTKR